MLKTGTQGFSQSPTWSPGGGESCLTIVTSVSKKDPAGYLQGEEEVLVGLFSTWPGWGRPDFFCFGASPSSFA